MSSATGGDVPAIWEVVANRTEAPEVVTLTVRPVDGAAPLFRPAQFSMIGIPGVGEVPVSVSSPTWQAGVHDYTIRRAGAVTARLVTTEPGDVVTIRGPFGSPWDLGDARGRPVLFVAGGIGIAPLKAAIEEVVRRRADFGPVRVLVGAVDADGLIYHSWLEGLRDHDVEVRLTVEDPDDGWSGLVGRVTDVLSDIVLDPGTVVLVCGPDPMMTAVTRAVVAAGVPAHQVQLTLERNMHCGTATCGHCQLGPLLLCRDGPVFRADRVVGLLEEVEL